ncbi:hypothetical protein PLESTM_000349900 [Pleodorina starrii]|nr:hypothetical protein PLESTM_000349900 [Pleodorina starrii]
MEEYEYLATLGEGAYGFVWKCVERATGRLVAIKGLKQAHVEPEIMRMAVREVRVLQSLKHPAIISLIEAFKSKSGRVYMVFPYVGHSAFQELDEHSDGLPGPRLKLLVWQLLQALVYLHKRKVVHRDIKPANILLSQDGEVKLCDFGFARATHCGPRDAEQLSSYVVTRWYRAPEVLVGDPYGPSSDIWSLGCTLAELASGQPLFPGKSTGEQLWRIMRCFGPLPGPQAARLASDPRLARVRAPARGRSLQERLEGCDPGLFQLLESCLQLDLRRRSTAAELLQSPYFWGVPKLLAGTPLEQMYGSEPPLQDWWKVPAPLQQHQQQKRPQQQQLEQWQQHQQQQLQRHGLKQYLTQQHLRQQAAKEGLRVALPMETSAISCPFAPSPPATPPDAPPANRQGRGGLPRQSAPNLVGFGFEARPDAGDKEGEARTARKGQRARLPEGVAGTEAGKEEEEEEEERGSNSSLVPMSPADLCRDGEKRQMWMTSATAIEIATAAMKAGGHRLQQQQQQQQQLQEERTRAAGEVQVDDYAQRALRALRTVETLVPERFAARREAAVETKEEAAAAPSEATPPAYAPAGVPSEPPASHTRGPYAGGAEGICAAPQAAPHAADAAAAAVTAGAGAGADAPAQAVSGAGAAAVSPPKPTTPSPPLPLPLTLPRQDDRRRRGDAVDALAPSGGGGGGGSDGGGGVSARNIPLVGSSGKATDAVLRAAAQKDYLAPWDVPGGIAQPISPVTVSRADVSYAVLAPPPPPPPIPVPLPEARGALQLPCSDRMAPTAASAAAGFAPMPTSFPTSGALAQCDTSPFEPLAGAPPDYAARRRAGPPAPNPCCAARDGAVDTTVTTSAAGGMYDTLPGNTATAGTALDSSVASYLLTTTHALEPGHDGILDSLVRTSVQGLSYLPEDLPRSRAASRHLGGGAATAVAPAAVTSMRLLSDSAAADCSSTAAAAASAAAETLFTDDYLVVLEEGAHAHAHAPVVQAASAAAAAAAAPSPRRPPGRPFQSVGQVQTRSLHGPGQSRDSLPQLLGMSADVQTPAAAAAAVAGAASAEGVRRQQQVSRGEVSRGGRSHFPTGQLLSLQLPPGLAAARRSAPRGSGTNMSYTDARSSAGAAAAAVPAVTQVAGRSCGSGSVAQAWMGYKDDGSHGSHHRPAEVAGLVAFLRRAGTADKPLESHDLGPMMISGGGAAAAAAGAFSRGGSGALVTSGALAQAFASVPSASGASPSAIRPASGVSVSAKVAPARAAAYAATSFTAGGGSGGGGGGAAAAIPSRSRLFAVASNPTNSGWLASSVTEVPVSPILGFQAPEGSEGVSCGDSAAAVQRPPPPPLSVLASASSTLRRRPASVAGAVATVADEMYDGCASSGGGGGRPGPAGLRRLFGGRRVISSKYEGRSAAVADVVGERGGTAVRMKGVLTRLLGAVKKAISGSASGGSGGRKRSFHGCD